MNEITINGIDVSKCPLYDKKTGCYHTFDGKCVKDSCAVYKWLLEHKRLQKENEGLKSLNDFNVQKIEVLKEENEELKKLKKYYKGFVANCRYCDEWYMDKCNYIKKENKYKQALEEIRKKLPLFAHIVIILTVLQLGMIAKTYAKMELLNI